MFIVYRATGPYSNLAYYGYAEGEDELDVRETFMTGATRGDAASADRGDVRFLEQNKNEQDMIRFQVLDVCADELEAFLRRNDERARNVDSITGPSMLPGNIAERAAAERPGRLTAMQQMLKARSAKTAREAWGLGMWTTATIRNLSAVFNKQQIILDLDALTPLEFQTKYNLTNQL